EAGPLGGKLRARLDRVAAAEPMHEPDALRLFGADRAPRQDQLERPRLADDSRQALGAAVARDQAELDLRKPELRVRRGEAEGRCQRELEPAAERVAVDDRDRGNRQRIQLRENRLAALYAPPLLREIAAAKLLDVGAGAECLAAGAGDHERANAHLGDRIERTVDLLEKSERQRVERLPSIEHENPDFIAACETERHQAISFVRHRTG